MGCACRTKSLRIFVQSLTDLRVAAPGISTPAQINHRSLPATFLHGPARLPTRLFSSASAAYYPRRTWRGTSMKPSEGTAEDETSSAIVDTVSDKKDGDASASTLFTSGEDLTMAKSDSDTPAPLFTFGDSRPMAKSNGGTRASALLTSDDDLAMAKSDGVILEYNPDSIESLATDFGATSIDGDPNTQRERRRRPKPPVGPSQLKRLKIIKDKPERELNKFGKPIYKEPWRIQKEALKEKFPEGWIPRKRISPDAMAGMRALHAQFPLHYTTPVLAKTFEISPEAVRRILKGKWRPMGEEEEMVQERWNNRGKSVWTRWAELGKKPPRQWREEGIVREPHWNVKKGPRTEWPYVPKRESVESTHRKVSGSLV